jgi:hypothetical protein
VNETLRLSLCQMDDAVTLLSSDIEQATAGIMVHHKVSQVLDAAVQGLAGVVREARRIAPSTGQAGNLEDLASRYTMQSERRIHESLLDPGGGSGQAPAPSLDDDLGGNVELF